MTEERAMTAVQTQALKRLGELGRCPYGWSATEIGASGRTLAALHDRGLVYGGNVYGSRTRTYILSDNGHKFVAQGIEAGTATTAGRGLKDESPVA